MSKPIFRKAALERLSTPEQLDQLVQVTTPRAWLALAGLGVAIVAALLWGFLGRIPIEVRGQGVIIRRGGTFNLVATHAGQIIELNVPSSHVVGRGAVIAKVAPPSIAAPVVAARGELTDLLHERETLLGQRTTAAGRDRARRRRLDQELTRVDEQIAAATNTLRGMEAQLTGVETIISPLNGHVLSLQAAVGDLVSVGTVLCNVEFANNDLIASVYVEPADGKKIQVDKAVQISPADVKREEYGEMRGRVAFVSGYPTTEREMMYLLQNESLVKLLAAHGAPFAVEVEFQRDASTPSGFAWSQPKGPPITISSGTICSARIVVGERRPVDLMIPRLRETLGI